ncbi:alpha-galactosidase [Curtobacterium sp. VKM Ac-2865]|uniref:glycoside hydrolase family 36 protein n=1 Tax=Curtobacterium sp. VKM Ac-2865 TaxID=2783817 RepID=UPI00188A84CE|nr:glycoside hydrolase family 36 protein [Curtobacterium sp. VKM Ac-2865]MBF4581604.1 alpha-galactosidase [Curtobacterium sp. VKM Ac-2865]
MPRSLRFDGTTIADADGLDAAALEGDRLDATAHGWLVGSGPVTIALDTEVTDFHRQGWTSWSPSGWAPLDESPLRIWGDDERRQTADDAANDTPDRHEGNGVGAVRLADGRVLLLGALGLGTPRVGAAHAELSGTVEHDDGSGWFLGLGSEETVFARYAELLRERLGTPTAPPVSTLWCSWYSYFEDIDEQLITTAVDDLGTLPIDVVQVDDGWETIVGDWLPNDEFPSGMEALAARLAARGSRPGLWLAPLICLPGSRTATEHPEWLVQDPSGGPLVAGHNWDSHYFALDTTRPDVQEHLATVIRRVVGWGFRYLKLDFMYAGALRGVRHQDLPRERVWRDAVELIRAAAGPDVYLLGCGVPMLPSVGVFDGVRVGPDTASDWTYPACVADPSHEGGLNGVAASVPRLWMRDLYQVDPDVAYFRSRETTLTSEQRQTIADLAVVSGFRSTSDPVAWLDAPEREAMARFLQQDPVVERLGDEKFLVDGRTVDFGPAVREARAGRERLTEAGSRAV